MAEEIISKQMTLLPEYQENFLKDLLSNIYNVERDADGQPTGVVTGIAAESLLKTLVLNVLFALYPLTSAPVAVSEPTPFAWLAAILRAAPAPAGLSTQLPPSTLYCIISSLS